VTRIDPGNDAVLMFKVLVLQTLYTLSDHQTEYQLKDRLSFMRFVGLALHDPVPDAKTVWLYREQLARAGAAEKLFARFNALLREKDWLAMGGQIIDATVIDGCFAIHTGRVTAAVRAKPHKIHVRFAWQSLFPSGMSCTSVSLEERLTSEKWSDHLVEQLVDAL
jgi:hypothetical protein